MPERILSTLFTAFSISFPVVDSKNRKQIVAARLSIAEPRYRNDDQTTCDAQGNEPFEECESALAIRLTEQFDSPRSLAKSR